MKRLDILAAAIAILGLAQSTPSHADTVPVSPGEIDRSVVVSQPCPTFSWTAARSDTESYELAIWKLTSDGPEDLPVLRRFVPSGALAWTPNRSDCLENGSRFAWSVRAWHSDGAGDWPGPRLFETPSGPTGSAAADALAALRNYLEAGGTLDSLFEEQPLSTFASVEARPVPAVNAGAIKAKQSPKAAKHPENPEDALATTPVRFDPALAYGFSSIMGGANASSTVAVQGLFDASASSDLVGGFLGVSVPDTDYFDFVSPYLDGLSADEIGVLGFSANSSSDNWGVVGVGGQASWGGRFIHSDAAGAVDNEVLMAGPDHAMYIQGDVMIRNGSISCPHATVRAGAWCILVFEQSPRTFENAVKNCWEREMMLCPLDAIMACDHLEPAGADCSTTTDTTDGSYRIFVGDLHTPFMIAREGVGLVNIFQHNAWRGGDAWVYAPYFDTFPPETPNVLGDHDKEDPAHSFCCTTPR